MQFECGTRILRVIHGRDARATSANCIILNLEGLASRAFISRPFHGQGPPGTAYPALKCWAIFTSPLRGLSKTGLFGQSDAPPINSDLGRRCRGRLNETITNDASLSCSCAAVHRTGPGANSR